MSLRPGPPATPSIAIGPSRLAGAFGLRTLRSPGFRAMVAWALVLVGVLVLGAAMLRQASQPAGQFAIDFGDYHGASRALLATGSPYAAEMLVGPVDAQGLERYRYPPPLAQVLVPLAGLPLGSAASAWLLLQAVSLVAAVWLALGVAGVPRHAERLAWSAASCLLFMPVFDALWKGNVSGFLALQVALFAMGGAVAGVAGVLEAVLKVAPIAMLPTLVVAGRRAVIAALLTSVAVVGASWLLSPAAWSDYATVLPNLLAGSSDYPTNLAPAAILAGAGLPAPAVTLVRAATLALAATCSLSAPLAARRVPGTRGWAAATTLGVAATLLLPAACWYHYLAALLPVGALAWPAGYRSQRVGLVAAAALISLGVAALPLALAGAGMLVIVALHVHLRAPRRPSSGPAGA